MWLLRATSFRALTCVRARAYAPRRQAEDADKTAGASPKEATEALKFLIMMGANEEAVAHRVAAILTGKKVDDSSAEIDLRAMAMSALTLVCAMPADKSRIEAQVTQNCKIEVEQKMTLVAEVAGALGPAAFIKLVPTQGDLHRHVAVLLPDYDSRYIYSQGDSSSSLKGPGGFKWKTRRSPDADNDPRFPDFW